MGLIFRSALPEELEWENRAEDVALSLDAINRCLLNMLTALDRDTPQTKNASDLHPTTSHYRSLPLLRNRHGSGSRSRS